MSRIGKKPIPVPAGVEVHLDFPTVTVTGAQGSLSRVLRGVKVLREGNLLLVQPDPEATDTAKMHGLMRTLLANMVEGCSTGFTRVLTISGTGYKAEGGGQELVLHLGYSRPVNFRLPEGVTGTVEDKGLKITLKSRDKELLGDTAARLRAVRPVEPYKGKGVAYLGEKVRKKAGKSGTK